MQSRTKKKKAKQSLLKLLYLVKKFLPYFFQC